MTEHHIHIGHLYGIRAPLGPAGGIAKTIEDVYNLSQTGVGWIEAGSYTQIPRPDLRATGQTTYMYDQISGELFNKFEMPNQGLDSLLNDLPEMLAIAHGFHKALVINIAPTSDNANKEVGGMVRALYDKKVDAVLINPDCPSLRRPDGSLHERISRNPDALQSLLAHVGETIQDFRSVFLRIAPSETLAHMQRTCDVVRNSGVVSALFVSNTWDITPSDIKHKPELEAWSGAGGKSGPAMAFRSANLTKWAVENLYRSNIDVVRSCGVATAKELVRSLDIGAVAAAGSTLFLESTSGWGEDVDRMLCGIDE